MKHLIFSLTLLSAPLGVWAADRAQNTIILDEMGVRNLGITTVEVDYRTFEETVFAIGRIVEIPASRSVLSTRIAGRVVELDAHEGEIVEKGQRLAVIESLQSGDPPPKVALYAPKSGLVVASSIRLGQPVVPSEELMAIADRTTVWAIAQIPEQEAAKVKVGTAATIRVPALGEALIEATITRLGLEADPRASTVAAIFTLPNPEGRLQPGMRAKFSIVLEKHTGVLAVPREAIQGDPTRRVVFVKDFELPNAFVRAPVVLGKTNERHVEVIEGLFPGDEVVTHGSYGLSFAGGGAGLSLKEALDAAHGHAHNEDGSELTGEKDAGQNHNGHDHGEGEEEHHHTEYMAYLIGYSALVTVALLYMLQQAWNHKRKARQQKETAPHA